MCWEIVVQSIDVVGISFFLALNFRGSDLIGNLTIICFDYKTRSEPFF